MLEPVARYHDRHAPLRVFNALVRAARGDESGERTGVPLSDKLRAELDAVLSGELTGISSGRLARLIALGLVTECAQADELRFWDQLDRGLRPAPRLELIEITTRCRMSCAFCGHGRMGRAREHMPRRRFVKALERIAATGQRRVALYGYGEPLLHPEIVDFVSLAAERGLEPWLSTVPVDLDGDLSRRLIDAGLAGINFSLDSLDPEVFRAVRGKHADLLRAVANIDAFLAWNRKRDHPVTTVVRMIALTENHGEETRFVATWRARGVDHVYVRPYIEAVPGRAAADGARRSLKICTWPWTAAVAWREGQVVACCMDYEGRLEMGSYESEDLAAIWKGARYAALRHGLRLGELPADHPCGRCPLNPRNVKQELSRLTAGMRSVAKLPVVAWES